LGARVTVLDRTESAAFVRLREAGATAVLGDEPEPALLAEIDDVIVSPGFAPHTPVARAALAAGLPVYSEPELAWRLRGPEAAGWSTPCCATTTRCWRWSCPASSSTGR